MYIHAHNERQTQRKDLIDLSHKKNIVCITHSHRGWRYPILPKAFVQIPKVRLRKSQH